MTEQERPQTEHDPTADALAAMAAGDAPAQAGDPQGAESAGSKAEAPAEGAYMPASPGAPAQSAPQAAGAADPLAGTGPASRNTIAARKAQAAAFQSKASEERAGQLKRLMIPMLLVTGLLLLILGTMAAIMLPSPEDRLILHPDSLLAKEWAKYLVYAAFPLAIILLVAAAIFRQDVRRSGARYKK